MTKSIKFLAAIALSSTVAAVALASHLSSSSVVYHRAPVEVPAVVEVSPAVAPSVDTPMAQVVVTGHRMSDAEKSAYDAAQL